MLYGGIAPPFPMRFRRRVPGVIGRRKRVRSPGPRGLDPYRTYLVEGNPVGAGRSGGSGRLRGRRRLAGAERQERIRHRVLMIVAVLFLGSTRRIPLGQQVRGKLASISALRSAWHLVSTTIPSSVCSNRFSRWSSRSTSLNWSEADYVPPAAVGWDRGFESGSLQRRVRCKLDA
jgi:hypothetical protein